MTKVFGIYPRKSKKSDNSQSMEQQIYDCEKYIRETCDNYEIILYDADYALTGHSTKHRKDFQRMMRDVRDHKLNTVVIMRYDRIARNMRDFCNLYYEMEQAGCDLVSVSQRIDTSTPYGKKFMYDMASMAELEWAITSERYKDTAKYKIQHGFAYTGSVPTGFKIEKVDGVKRIVRDNIETTYNILEYYKTSKSKRSTVAYTREHWIPDFTTNKLNALLYSDLLFGTCRGNKNFCEPYYTEEEVLELRNISQIKTTPSGNIYLFTGLIRCPICGSSMNGLYSNRKSGTKGKRILYTYYRCSKGGKYKLHRMNSLNQDTVEKYLLDNLDAELNRYIIKAKSQTAPKKKTTDQQAKIRAELERVNYMFEKGRLAVDEYEAKYTALSDKLNALIRESNVTEDKIIQLTQNIPENWRQLYEKLDLTGKQRFWHSIISDITLAENHGFTITGFHFL